MGFWLSKLLPQLIYPLGLGLLLVHLGLRLDRVTGVTKAGCCHLVTCQPALCWAYEQTRGFD